MNKSKIFIATLISFTILSCGSSIESDAQKAGKLMCEAQKNPSKKEELSTEILKISRKYNDDDSIKFDELAQDEFEKCFDDSKVLENTSIEPVTNDAVTDKAENIDAMLDSYESYVDEYIKYMKKIKNGDTSAYSDMLSIMSKAEDLDNKMEDAKGDMTSKQLTRMTTIIGKMNKAVAEMQ